MINSLHQRVQPMEEVLLLRASFSLWSFSRITPCLRNFSSSSSVSGVAWGLFFHKISEAVWDDSRPLFCSLFCWTREHEHLKQPSIYFLWNCTQEPHQFRYLQDRKIFWFWESSRLFKRWVSGYWTVSAQKVCLFLTHRPRYPYFCAQFSFTSKTFPELIPSSTTILKKHHQKFSTIFQT